MTERQVGRFRPNSRGWRSVATLGELPQAGCYAIYHDGRLVYIGSSKQLRSRLAQYLGPHTGRPRRPVLFGGPRARHAAVAVTVKVAPSVRLGDWLTREYRLIHRLKPRDNKSIAGNIRTRFRRVG